MRKSRRLNRFKDFILKHKNQFIAGVSVILLALITLYFSYAYYQTVKENPIIGGQVGEIPDLEVRIMAQKRDGNGNAIKNEYELYPYIPQAGYDYNQGKSSCVNGSTISYNPKDGTYEATVTATKVDVCYLYFDSNAPLDITLEVYAQNIDENGKGLKGNYTKLETSSLPSVGYKLGSYNCNNEATASYDAEQNLISVDTQKRNTKCTVYMDAIDVDVMVKLHLEKGKNTSKKPEDYYDAKTIPANVYYEQNTALSSCTNNGTISYVDQSVSIASSNRTVCNLYLNIGSGPITASILPVINGKNTQISFAESNLGTNVSTWHYSLDGVNYESTTEDTVTIPGKVDNLYVYGEDASGKTSRVIATNGESYIYNGDFNYSSSVQTKEIEVSGYYKLEVWGAQGGSYNPEYAQGGKGGYSVGTIYLNKGDTLFIHTGGSGSYNPSLTTIEGGGLNGGGNAGYRGGTGGGATDIRINEDNLYSRVIVAGGGGGAYSYNSTYKADGGYAGGFTAGRGNYVNDYANWAGGAGSLVAGGLGGVGLDTLFNGGNGSFGEGGSTGQKISDAKYYSSGAGGGGFYGGGAGANFNGQDYKKAAAGGGGSGYIYTESTAKYYPEGCLLNANYYLVKAQSLSGNTEFLSPTGQKETGHADYGYAKVTYLGQTIEEE